MINVRRRDNIIPNCESIYTNVVCGYIDLGCTGCIPGIPEYHKVGFKNFIRIDRIKKNVHQRRLEAIE